MENRDTARAAAALAALVALSSLLGLSGRFLLFDLGGAFAFVVSIWTQSILADLVFVAGSAGVAAAAWRLAQESRVPSAIAAGAVGHWLVYVASFLLLPQAVAEYQGAMGEAFLFVAMWGLPGLVFAALAPPLAALVRARRLAQAAPAGDADAEATAR